MTDPGSASDPLEAAPAHGAPVDDGPVDDASVEDALVDDAPAEDAPVEGVAGEEVPEAMPARPSVRTAALWLVAVGAAVALDGLVGGLVLVFVAAVLLAGAPRRAIGAVGVTLLVAAPVAFLAAGVPTSRTISPTIVTRSLVPHHLTFAGLVLVSAYALLDLAPHLRAWATAERPPQDDGPPLGVVAGAVVVAVVAVGAVLACRAVLGA